MTSQVVPPHLSRRIDPLALFGAISAEHDPLLGDAFFRTHEYDTLEKSESTTVVVGRRGSGKTALAQQLAKHYSANKAVRTVLISPVAEAMLLLRKYALGLPPNYQKAVFKKAWRGAIVGQALALVEGHYKIRGHALAAAIKSVLGRVGVTGVVGRAEAFLREACPRGGTPDEILHSVLEHHDLVDPVDLLGKASKECGVRIQLIVDRVDEGYEPDKPGIAIAAALVAAATELGQRECFGATAVFLRDNMVRALSKHDPDYSRVVEGRVLRLHWSESDLFHMVAERIRVAKNLGALSARDCWNSLVTRELCDQSGFRKALYHTLHRPRDIVLLLNRAHWEAAKNEGNRIAPPNMTAAAQSISATRLEDMIGEYKQVVPAVRGLVHCLVNGPRIWQRDLLLSSIAAMTAADDLDAAVLQDLRMRQPSESLRVMYEAGLVGVRDATSGRYMFCYDGVAAQADLGVADLVMVHPCYWLALGIVAAGGKEDQGPEADVSDEYEITVLSPSREHRTHKVGQVVAKLAAIPDGDEGWSAFEDWCLEVVRVVFAGSLRNIEARPNGVAPNRRDIVGRNSCETGFWKRVREDYGVRQIVFEVKNYAAPGPDDLRQVCDYLSGQYGTLGFLICRGADTEVRNGPLLERMRRIWAEHRKVVIVVGDRWLKRILEKLRNPERQSYPDEASNKLLDTYERRYR